MARVKHFSEIKSTLVQEGVHMRMVIGAEEGAPVFNMRIFDVQPGACTPHHQHWWEHEVFVLEGEGIVKSNLGETNLKPGTSVFIERNELHQFVNTGKSLFRFMCLVPQDWLEGKEKP